MTRIRSFGFVMGAQQEYYPGQTVQGQVLVDLTEPTVIKGIKVKCKGQAYVEWTEGTGDDRKRYSDMETYMNAEHEICGGGQGSQEICLNGGQTKFPFQLILSVGIPRSFEGGIGFVRYWLKAYMTRADGRGTEKQKMPITVNGFGLDLNTIPEALNIVQTTDSKTLCCCCCESDPIVATLKVARTGHIAGEYIDFSYDLDDRANRGFRNTRVRFIKETTFTTRGGSSTKNIQQLDSLQQGRSPPGSTVASCGNRLQIPAFVETSGFPGCNLIDIQYFVELIVDIFQTPFDLILRAPIIIGTTPHNLSGHPHVGILQIHSDVITSQPLSTTIDSPPPSYGEVMAQAIRENDK